MADFVYHDLNIPSSNLSPPFQELKSLFRCDFFPFSTKVCLCFVDCTVLLQEGSSRLDHHMMGEEG